MEKSVLSKANLAFLIIFCEIFNSLKVTGDCMFDKYWGKTLGSNFDTTSYSIIEEKKIFLAITDCERICFMQGVHCAAVMAVQLPQYRYRCKLVTDLPPEPFDVGLYAVDSGQGGPSSDRLSVKKWQGPVDRCSSQPCNNGGSCTETYMWYRCLCPQGFSGENCEIDIYECGSSPCQNGGTCLDGINYYDCVCNEGYYGTNCELGTGCNIDSLTGSVKYVTAHGLTFPAFIEDSAAGDNWIVLMRRVNGSVDFNQEWEDYKDGFGDLTSDFWLGNDKMYLLASNGISYTVRFDLGDWNGVCKYAEYSMFRLLGESENYKLLIGQHSGTAGDSMSYHNYQSFSTSDRDNDQYAGNCAASGGWWYNGCYSAMLTGPFGQNETGFRWLNGFSMDQLKYADMKIKVNLNGWV